MNLRMEDIANQVGITRSTLWSIENGSGNYTIDTLIKILNVLNLEIDISSFEYDDKRSRATRINKVSHKKINSFVVMCVEQYACHFGLSSYDSYRFLNKNGIVNELIDDYDDMHSMSSDLINEYIVARTKEIENETKTNTSIIMEHVLAKTILISEVINLIAKNYKLTIDEARDKFYSSDIINMLDDDETGLYGQSALYIFSLYEEYVEKNK